jgi:hypothetical protein
MFSVMSYKLMTTFLKFLYLLLVWETKENGEPTTACFLFGTATGAEEKISGINVTSLNDWQIQQPFLQ